MFLSFSVPEKIPEMQKMLEAFLKIADTNRQLMMTGPADNFKSLLMLLRFVLLRTTKKKGGGGLIVQQCCIYLYLEIRLFDERQPYALPFYRLSSFDDHAVISAQLFLNNCSNCSRSKFCCARNKIVSLSGEKVSRRYSKFWLCRRATSLHTQNQLQLELMSPLLLPRPN